MSRTLPNSDSREPENLPQNIDGRPTIPAEIDSARPDVTVEKVKNLYARITAGTSQTNSATLCLNLALRRPTTSAGPKLNKNMSEKRNSNLLDDEEGRCRIGSNVSLYPARQPECGYLHYGVHGREMKEESNDLPTYRRVSSRCSRENAFLGCVFHTDGAYTSNIRIRQDGCTSSLARPCDRNHCAFRATPRR